MPKTTEIIAQALKEHGVTHAFGIPGGEVLARMQLTETGVRTASPDYAILAKAYGGQGVVVEDVKDLRRAAQAALAASTFTLIDARIDQAEYRKQM